MLCDTITNTPDRYTCCRHGDLLGKAVCGWVVQVAAMGDVLCKPQRMPARVAQQISSMRAQ